MGIGRNPFLPASRMQRAGAPATDTIYLMEYEPTPSPQLESLEAVIREAWIQVLDSDPLKYVDIGANGAPQPDAWLLEHYDEWLLAPRRPSIDGSSARVVLVIGEAGCGKSTTMRLIYNDARRLHRTPIFIDFSHVPTTQGRRFSEDELTRALASFISNKIRSQMAAYGLTASYDAQLVKHMLRESYSPALEKLRKENAGIEDWSDNRLAACQEALEASRELVDSQYEEFFPLSVVQLVPEAPRPVLLFDNLEGLPPLAREILIGKLSAVHRPRTQLFIAMRSENRRQADILLQDRNDEIFQLEQVDGSLLDIASIRNGGARNYVRWLGGSGEFAPLGVDPSQLLTKSEEQWEAFDRAIGNLKGDEYSYAMASNWLNSNVRNFLGLMAELSRRIPEDPDWGELRAWLSSTLFRTRTHSSLFHIFSSAHYASTKHSLPFVFLPLRILFYIHTRGGSASIADLRDDFAHHFGIVPNDIRDALTSFTAREPGYPQPLRVYTDPDGSSHVILLKCGTVFVEKALYQFDFLANLFDKVENREFIVHHKKLSVDSGSMPDSRLKLLKAAAVIDELVLPTLCLEHPYMKTGRKISGDEYVRLESYDTMFRFGRERWFIGALRVAMEEFAEKRGYLDDVRSTISLMLQYEKRLNDALAEQSGDE